MTQQEDYFPRGGIQKKTDEPAKKVRKTENLFNVSEDKSKSSKAKKSLKNRKARENAEEDNSLHLESVDTLSYKKTQEGMLILGCIRQIKLVSFEVELPGRTYGLVLIKNISQPFSKRLQQQITNTKDDVSNLNAMFSPGQFLPTKVMTIEDKDDKGVRVHLSIDPVDVNAMLRHTHLRKGMLVWGAIAEKHDHGYVVDLGIPNCRAMLKTEEEEEQKHYEIGRPFYSVITKCESTNLATIITLTDKLSEESNEDSEMSIDHLIPGMGVKYTINSKVKHGLEGTFLNGYTGYVNDLYLNCPLDNLSKYKDGQVVRARVMYVQPSTKFTYFTLRGLESVSALSMKLGSKLQGQVRERLSNGIVIKMNATDLGFVSHNRIIRGLNTNKDFKEVINDKYALGTNHQCAVIGYNNFERMYICTFESDVLKDGFATIGDMHVGQETQAVVTEFKPQGLVVKIGKIEGFVSNLHLSSAIYSENIKSKFKVGQKVKARVWFIDESLNKIQLTFKPELVKDGRLLDSKSRDEKFLGMVGKATCRGVLVVFLGNVTGWLPNNQIPQLSGKDASKIFYEGQIISCSVSSTNDDGKIVLTQRSSETGNKKRGSTEKKEEKSAVVLGEIIETAKVTRVSPEGLDLRCDERGVSMFLPAEHAWGKEVMQTYKEDDVVKKLICICTKNRIVVSMNEIRYFRPLKPENIVKNAVIRCYYYKPAAQGVLLFAPSNKYKTIFINNKNFDAPPTLNFEPFQVVYCKVISERNHAIIATMIVDEMFQYTDEMGYLYLSEYLERVENAKARLRQSGNELAKLEIGQVVDCVVNKVDKNLGCSVRIKSTSCNGIIEASQMSGEKVKPKDHRKAVVVGINFEHKYAQLTFKPSVLEKSLAKTKPSMETDKKNNFAYVLTVNDKYALAHHSSGHFVHIPMQMHNNDFNPQKEYYTALLNKRIKLVNCTDINGVMFGTEKKMHGILSRIHNGARSKGCFKPDGAKRSHEQMESGEDVYTTASNSEEGNMDNNEDEDVAEEMETNENDAEMEESNDEDQANGDNESDESANEEEMETEQDDAGFKLPGMDDFFDTSKNDQEVDNETSSDEDEKEDEPAKKKKKLSAAERLEMAKEEERRLLKIENELAESANLPQSAEQFDRVLLGNPDDSEMWMRYIAFHTQATELEKARAVVKRALEKISYDATQDRLNVWLAYLNLENMYGTKATFDKVFEEACRCNDSLSVYLESIKMLAEMQKFGEMDEKIKKVRQKFKEEPKMWLELAKVYYKCKRFVDARKLKDIAITTISNKKTHVDLLVQFAIMEFNDGEEAHGEALFETIIQTDVKRVDVWSTYIDQLIKRGKIDIARNVLTRAIGQKLIYKKMRTLFKKYIAFEKEHGNEETLERATNLLKEYTKQ